MSVDISILSLIFSCVSFFISLHYDKKFHNQSMALNNERDKLKNEYTEWYKKFETNKLKINHLEQELNNISTMKPYFHLEPDSISKGKNYYEMNVNLRNIGNGTAVNVRVDSNGGGLNGYIISDTEKKFTLVGPPSLSQDIAVVNDKTKASIRSELSEYNSKNFQAGTITFTILYQDLMNRSFKQSVKLRWIFNWKGNQQLEFSDYVTSGMPEILEED